MVLASPSHAAIAEGKAQRVPWAEVYHRPPMFTMDLGEVWVYVGALPLSNGGVGGGGNLCLVSRDIFPLPPAATTTTA